VPRVHELTEDLLAFWQERHLCTVTTLRADGSPHVVPMGVALDAEGRVAWAITSGTSQKVANLRRNALVAVCQVDRGRWSTIEGRAEVHRDAASVAEAVRRYAERYRPPRENPSRVAIRIQITAVIGNV
jgi:PPOX class probable F420-dependent enzyme